MAPIKGKRLTVWLIVGFLLTSTFVGTNVYVAHHLEHTDRMENLTFEVISQLQNVESHLAAAESESRGFLITGDPAFMPSFASHTERALHSLRQLESLVADNPAQQARLDLLRPLVYQKINIMALAVGLHRGGSQAPASYSQQTVAGKAAMLRIQQIIATMRATEEQLLALRQANRVQSLRNSQYMTYSAAALNVLLLVVLVALFNWELAQRRRFTEMLQQKALENKRVLDSSLDLICAMDKHCRFTSVSRAAEDLLGYAPWELIGQEYLPLVHPDDLARTRARAARVVAGNPAREFENRYLRKDGTTVSLVWSAFWSEEDELMYCVARDNTERRKIDRLKNEFISTVSHELRTPLTSIRGALGLVCEGVTGDMPPKAKNLLDIALSSSDRLVRLINDLLDISKIESGKMDFRLEDIDIKDLVSQAIDASRAYGDSLSVSLSLDYVDTARVRADKDRLQQVLANLLSNAIKYSKAGSQVIVRIKRHKDRVRVAVHDTGPGVPESFKSRIFQKFAQADSSDTRQRGGTGLGLSIAKAIVEKLGGCIGFEPNVRGGSIFYFDLPLQDDDLSRHNSLRQVLMVSGQAAEAIRLREILGQEGCGLEVANSIGQARIACAQRRYDALILDPVLPDGDGLSLLSELRGSENTRSVPAILMAAALSDTDRKLEGAVLEVVDWLQKPIDQPALVNAVQIAIQHTSNRRAHVLHVEDDDALRHSVKAILGSDNTITEASTVQVALQLLEDEAFDLVILDMGLPDGCGMKVVEYLQCHHLRLPVIIFAEQDQQHALATKLRRLLLQQPDDVDALLQAIRRQLPQRLAGATAS